MFGKYKWAQLSQQKLDTYRRNNSGKLSYRDSSDKLITTKTKDPETGITVSYDMRLAVVKPVQAYMPCREDVDIVSYEYSCLTASTLLDKLGGIVAVDIETRGTQAAAAECEIVGIGMADAQTILYFDFATNGEEVNQLVLDWLASYKKGLVAHNAFFDGAFLQRYTDTWLDWRYDTYALYKQLATEGYPGQKWGLKDAQLQLLKWETKGDVQLDEWLVHNGYIADVKKEEKEGYIYLADYCGEDGTSKGERWCKARKSEMWRAPAEILGFYCGLDAASTWQLLNEVFLPSIHAQPYEQVFLDYHKVFIDNVRLMVAQQLSGITIDKQILEAHHVNLLSSISKHYDNFLAHPDIRPVADIYRQAAIEAEQLREPAKYKKQKVSKEPKKFKKDGTVSKVWMNWEARTKEVEKQGPVVTAHYTGWEQRMREVREKEHLNPNSSMHMQDLLYNHLGYEVLVKTEKGLPSTGAKALPGFGEVGKLLKAQKDDIKEESYVKSCLEHLMVDANGHHRLHPQFRMPGTLTCRLAGSGGLNLQQIPKSRQYLEAWKPVPGKAWIDCDHTSLEQVVMAELSKDPSLYKIYGPNAKPNDIYLFNGSQLPVIGEKIRTAGYDPDNPTAEAIAKVKKECKKERGIAKVITLGCLPAGTLIRTKGRGIIPIDRVTTFDVIWDGEYWVACSGAQYMGHKKCQPVTDKIWSTTNHEFLTTSGWQTQEQLGKVPTKDFRRPRRARSDWADVWKLGSQLLSIIFKGKI